MPVYVLDGDDVPNPEDIAMLQALYSRSPQSVLSHLEKVREAGSGKFMGRYYTGYGHKSIGDCGTTTAFIEKVSMLAAKAIQHQRLYNGQEASTRYLDFSELGAVNPCDIAGERIQTAWFALYKHVLDTLIPHFEERFPREEGQKKGVWRKAIKARAFDVARGFLPAGARTFVAWHTNLRQAADHLARLRHHPLTEVRDLAEEIHSTLSERYPASFGQTRREDRENYIRASMESLTYQRASACALSNVAWDHSLDLGRIGQHESFLERRPPRTELHPFFNQFGWIEFEFGLDFGSWRDIQRHRSCDQIMPLLTVDHGFHPWYLDQLPHDLYGDVLHEIRRLGNEIVGLDASPTEKQYLIAMGFVVPVYLVCTLPSAVYIAELRSGTTVHPTLRIIAQQMGEILKTLIPTLAMHHDMSDGVWDIKRGTQDIVEKDS